MTNKSVSTIAKRRRAWGTLFLLALLISAGMIAGYFDNRIVDFSVLVIVFLAAPLIVVLLTTRCPRCGWNLFVKKNAISNTWTSPSIPDHCPNCDLDGNKAFNVPSS